MKREMSLSPQGIPIISGANFMSSSFDFKPLKITGQLRNKKFEIKNSILNNDLNQRRKSKIIRNSPVKDDLNEIK